MKHFLLATVLGISGKIYAEDNIDSKKVPTSQNETSQVKPISNVSDLMYFPSKGTFGGATKYSYASINQVLEYQSKEFTNTKIKTSSLEQTLGFAYDSKTLFGAILSYQLDSEASTSYGPGSTRNGQSAKNKSEKGLEDPTIFLSERIKFQETDNFNIDTTIRFSPKTGTAKSSTVAKEGNALRGANEFEFEVNLGKKNEKSSWKAGLSYSLTGEAKSEDAEVPADLTISESSNLYGLSFSYQWVVNNDFEINLNTGIAFTGAINSVNSYSHIKNEIDGATVVTIGPTFVLNYSPKTTIEFGILGTSVGERTFKQTDTTTNVVTSLNVKAATSGNFTLTTKYEF